MTNVPISQIPINFENLDDGDFIEYDAQKMMFVVKKKSEKQKYDGGKY